MPRYCPNCYIGVGENDVICRRCGSVLRRNPSSDSDNKPSNVVNQASTEEKAVNAQSSQYGTTDGSFSENAGKPKVVTQVQTQVRKFGGVQSVQTERVIKVMPVQEAKVVTTPSPTATVYSEPIFEEEPIFITEEVPESAQTDTFEISPELPQKELEDIYSLIDDSITDDVPVILEEEIIEDIVEEPVIEPISVPEEKVTVIDFEKNKTEFITPEKEFNDTINVLYKDPKPEIKPMVEPQKEIKIQNDEQPSSKVPAVRTKTKKVERVRSITVQKWLLTLLLCFIPFVNIAVLIVWSMTEKNKTKKNFAIAALIWLGIIIVISLIIFICVSSVSISAMVPMALG